MARLARILGILWRGLDGLRKALHLVLLLAIFAVLIVAAHPPSVFVPARAALVLHPQGRLVEQLSGNPLDRSLGSFAAEHEPETLVRDLTDAIGAAAKDERIRVLVLDVEDLGSAGLTKLQAVAEAIRAFRAGGKKVLAFARSASQEQYFLMAQADEAYLDPMGEVEVVGFGAYRLYYHEALDKLGVEVNVFKVGTHKSFTEPFTRQDMSPEDREQTLGVINPLWRAYQKGVESPRKLAPGAVDGYVHGALPDLKAAEGDAALMAQQRGLITGRKNSLEFEQQLIRLVGEDDNSHSFNAVDHEDYLLDNRPEQPRRPDGVVAVLVASGNIVDGDRPPGEIGGDSFAALLRKARYDKDVKAVVMRIDSGGGSMLASEVIRQEVVALKASGKPVIASFSSVAASGGYYIAMDADRIFAEPTTVTGSIGVFGVLPTFQKTLGKLGVASDGVATSALAGAFDLERTLDPTARELLQVGVEHAYHDFVGKVARARHKKPAEIETIAEGRVWIAPEALKLGLIDELGDLKAAVTAAAKRAHLEPGRYAISWREKELTWRETLIRQLHGEGLALAERLGLVSRERSAVGRVLDAAEHELRSLESFNDPRHAYFYCACELR